MDIFDELTAETNKLNNQDATTKEVSFAVIGFAVGMATGVLVTTYLFLNI